jgi:hypothetical protein
MQHTNGLVKIIKLRRLFLCGDDVAILQRPFVNQYLEQTEKERGRRAAFSIEFPATVERLEKLLGRTATVTEIEMAIREGIPKSPPARPSPLEFYDPDMPALILSPLAKTTRQAPERGVLGLGVVNLKNWPILRKLTERKPTERTALF